MFYFTPRGRQGGEGVSVRSTLAWKFQCSEGIALDRKSQELSLVRWEGKVVGSYASRKLLMFLELGTFMSST